MTHTISPAEDRIKEAAKKVFLEKGYDGTTTRDIAKEAGLNMALLNYYFRNKEKLFLQIYSELAGTYFKELIDLMNQPIELKEKISAIMDNHFGVLSGNPHLAAFIPNELARNPETMCKALNMQKGLGNTLFEKQWIEAVEKREVRAINFKHIPAFIISNIEHLFAKRQLTMQIWNMNQTEYEQFAKKHFQLSKEMILQFLFTTS
jgi:TetR/AcrR family transcriptional regulator